MTGKRPSRTVASKKTRAAAPPEQLFFNRDDSWLRFNGRVLEEAQDETNPLLERVKFLAITASNLADFVQAQYDCWNDLLLPALERENIRLLCWNQLDDNARDYALDFYAKEV